MQPTACKLVCNLRLLHLPTYKDNCKESAQRQQDIGRGLVKEIKEVQQQTAEAATLLHSLNHPDSLERFAREQYKMHTDKEDVYIVE